MFNLEWVSVSCQHSPLWIPSARMAVGEVTNSPSPIHQSQVFNDVGKFEVAPILRESFC